MAQASFVYTTLTGRYGIDISKKAEGQDWMMTKIGYDTAWTMSTLQARSPGFIVRPSNVNTLSLKKDQEDTFLWLAIKTMEGLSKPLRRKRNKAHPSSTPKVFFCDILRAAASNQG